MPTDTTTETPSSTTADTQRLVVHRVSLDSLAPDPANAREHGAENLDAIVASLRRFGQAEPLIVQAGTRRVVAGHGRLTAMKKLGWESCDVVELGIDDLTATALAIALNRTGELASWNEDTLARLLQELRAADSIDGVGFSNDQIDTLLAEMADASPVEVDDPGPEMPQERAITQTGDVWSLGAHRLQCGDSTKSEDIARLMNGETAQLLSTDPPYCVNYTGADRPGKNGENSGGKDWSATYREVDIKDVPVFMNGWLSAGLPHCRERIGIYIWHAHAIYPVIVEAMQKNGLLAHQQVVWVKPVATLSHSFYQYRHEPCLFGWRQGFKPDHCTTTFGTVWECDYDGKNRMVGAEHPCQKPTRLYEIPIEQHTAPGAIVLEPFSGSGSQIIAAEKLRRRCYANEVQPVFVEVAIRRWERATGKTATLDGSGKSFAEVETERLGSR